MFHEPFRMCGVRGTQHPLALLQNQLRLAVMHDPRREQRQTRVMMLLIVPGEERVRPRSGLGETAEPLRIVRAILQGFELSFRLRIVIGHVWARMRFDDIQVDEQLGHALGDHRTAIVRMQR